MDSNPMDESPRRGIVEDDADVQAHGIPKHVDGPETDDVEGHMPRIKFVDAEEPSDESVEGHKIARIAEDDQDVEGHRVSRVTGDDEDTEGHRVSR